MWYLGCMKPCFHHDLLLRSLLLIQQWNAIWWNAFTPTVASAFLYQMNLNTSKEKDSALHVMAPWSLSSQQGTPPVAGPIREEGRRIMHALPPLMTADVTPTPLPLTGASEKRGAASCASTLCFSSDQPCYHLIQAHQRRGAPHRALPPLGPAHHHHRWPHRGHHCQIWQHHGE